jgi:hypothetical protein
VYLQDGYSELRNDERSVHETDNTVMEREARATENMLASSETHEN